MHLFDNFWLFKTQNTEYNYIYVENCIYKRLKEAVKIYKKQTKSHRILAKINKVYIICTLKCDAFGNSFFSLLSTMECYKPNRWQCSIFFTLHCTVSASFGNVVNVLHDYQLIQVGSSS